MPHKEHKFFPPKVVEEAFWILAEEDVRWEKWKMKQQLSIQWWKSQQLYRIAKNDCWSDDVESSGNDVQVQLNNREMPYELCVIHLYNVLGEMF